MHVQNRIVTYYIKQNNAKKTTIDAGTNRTAGASTDSTSFLIWCAI